MKVVSALLLAALAAPASAEEEEPPAEPSATPAPSESYAYWPLTAIDRPYTRPKGKITAYADLGIGHSTRTDPMTMMSEGTTSEGMLLGGSYGITDSFGLGVQYAFTLNEFEIQGPLTLFGEFQIKNTNKLNVTAAADFDLNLCGTNDPTNGNCKATKALNLGAAVRYLVMAKLGIYSGGPFGRGPLGRQFSISLDSDGPIDLHIPVGVEYQATFHLLAFLQTELATLHFNPGAMQDSVSLIGDSVPLGLGALYAINRNFDVVAQFTTDLRAVGDAWAVSLGMSWFN